MYKFLIFLFVLTAYGSQAQQLSVFFDSKESILSEKDKQRLDSLIGTFQTELFYDIKLVGHTDSIGSLEKNKQLSKARATVVYSYLPKRKNIRFTMVAGKAAAIPVQSNSTIDGRSHNRRCDVYITVSQVKKANWVMPVQNFNVSNSNKSILYTKNGCKIYVLPGTFQVKSTDTVSIQITEYKTPTDFIAGNLPMSYVKNGKTYMFESEQMMKVEAFVDTVPIPLMKLLGLQCPNIDTSGGVHFYEFSGTAAPSANMRIKLVPGRVEIVAVTVAGDSISAAKEKASESKVVPQENKPIVKKEIPKPAAKPTKKSGAFSIGRKKYPEFKEDPEKVKTVETDIEIEPDTSRSFKIVPDTSKEFILKPDTSKGFSLEPGYVHYWWSDNNSYCLFKDKCSMHMSICDTAFVRDMIMQGLKYKGKKFLNTELIDINSYYTRYMSFAYDGMDLKCAKKPEDLYSVRMTYKKKGAHRTAVKIKYFANNPEYKPLKKVKWIINAPINNKQVELLKQAAVSDFMILPYSYQYQADFYIEIKSVSSIYVVPVEVGNYKKTRKKYELYEERFRERVIAFNNDIEKYIADNKLEELYCLYSFVSRLSKDKHIDNHCYGITIPACHPFEYSKNNNDTISGNMYSCMEQDKCILDFIEFVKWLRFYNNNMDLFQQELASLNVREIIGCECKHTVLPDCYSKWKHHDVSPNGNNIINIGLGEYNFDREMSIEKQQLIRDAVFFNEQGDTILKCTKYVYKYKQVTSCHHTTYTIIPGFNGLLKQTDPAVLKLLPGKQNMLYFENYGRKYKLYLDLTNVETYSGTVFILKEITEQAETLEGLKNELEKVD